MIGPDVLMSQTKRLLLGEDDHLPRGLCESLEQVPRIAPAPRSRKENPGELDPPMRPARPSRSPRSARRTATAGSDRGSRELRGSLASAGGGAPAGAHGPHGRHEPP